LDLLVNNFYNVDTNEATALEELIGCHGGGYQTRPFLINWANRQLEEDKLVGTATIYRQLKTWPNQFEPTEADRID